MRCAERQYRQLRFGVNFLYEKFGMRRNREFSRIVPLTIAFERKAEGVRLIEFERL